MLSVWSRIKQDIAYLVKSPFPSLGSRASSAGESYVTYQDKGSRGAS